MENEPQQISSTEQQNQTPPNLEIQSDEEAQESRNEGWQSAIRQKFESAVTYLGSLLKNPEKQKQEKTKQEATELARQSVHLEYRNGQGVASMLSPANKETGKITPILAPDFRDCCGVIMKSEKGVAVVHISPYVQFDGEQDQTMQFSGIELKNRNYYEHLDRYIKELSTQDSEGNNLPPSMQIIGGQPSMVGVLENKFSNPAKQIGTEFGVYSFPQIKPEVYMAGNDPKAIIASSESTYIIEQAGDQRAWKADENCPFRALKH